MKHQNYEAIPFVSSAAGHIDGYQGKLFNENLAERLTKENNGDAKE